MNENFTIWMPVTKTISGTYSAILTDTSIDRDNELMDSNLIKQWGSNNTLPALVNHENKMEKWVGGWKNLKVVNKGQHTALLAEPFFFSEKANPLASQIEKQIEEAINMGLNPGVSITAIPKKSETKEINGKMYKVYTEAELLEATWVPLQSNRNAYGFLAKEFDIDVEIIEEEEKMTNEDIKQEVVEQEVVQQEVEPIIEESKQLAEKDEIIAKLNKEIESLQKKAKELELLSNAPSHECAVKKQVDVVDDFYKIYKAK